MLAPAQSRSGASRLLYRYVFPSVGVTLVAYVLYRFKEWYWSTGASSDDRKDKVTNEGYDGDDMKDRYDETGVIVDSGNEFLSNAPTAFTLLERVSVTHNADIFRFALPADRALGLEPGQHLFVSAKVEEDRVLVKPYNPITTNEDVGHFDLLVKMYNGGQMSEHFAALQAGDHVDMMGPGSSFVYRAGVARHLVMLIGGTGLTPMVSIIKTILSNPDDETNVSIIYASLTEEDILLRDWLDSIQSSPQVNVHHMLLKPPDHWQGGQGLVNAHVIKAHLTKPYSDVLVLLCGPRTFEEAMITHFRGMDFPTSHVITFGG